MNGSWQKTFLWDYERLGNKLMFFPLPADKKLCGTAVNESSARTKEKKGTTSTVSYIIYRKKVRKEPERL